MTDPEMMSMDAETRKYFEQEASRRGMTPERYFRWLREHQATGGVSPWGMPAEHLPSSLPGAGTMTSPGEMLQQAMQMRMLELMDGGKGKGVTREDVAEIVVAALERTGRGNNGGEKPADRIKAILAEKVEMKMLKDLAGDDEGMKRYADAQQAKLDGELKALNDRMAASETAHVAAIAAKDAEIARRDADAKEEQRKREMTELEGRLGGMIAELASKFDQQAALTGGPQPAAADVIAAKFQETKALVEGIKSLQSEFLQLAPKAEAPTGQSSVWDKASYLLQQVAEAGSQLMEGAGALVAARSGGVPPSQLGRMPGPGADDTAYVPDYAGGPAAVPPGYQPAAPAPAAPAPAPRQVSPDEELFPKDVMYIDPKTNSVISRDAFINLYGDQVRRNPASRKLTPVGNPSMGGAPPPMRAAPPPPAPAPAPASTGVDLDPNEGRPPASEQEAPIDTDGGAGADPEPTQ